jgi:hypothetical protein
MARGLNSDLQTALTNRQVLAADLVELHFTPAVYFTNASIDINYDSTTAPDTGTNTYLAQGQFIEFTNIKETADVKVNSLDISFTAVDLTTVALVLNNDYIDKRVVLYRVIFELDGTLNSNKVFQIFDGKINAWTLGETQDSATLTIQCSSQFADFEKLAGRTTSVASQQLVFPNDNGMEFASQIVKDIRWGRE